MRIGSLFSGIGGLELGLERAGVGHTVWQVEQDPYCRAALARHWPNAQRHDDVRTVGAHNLTAVDVLCGGFPCQDISYAGKGLGLAGARSGLWHEFARIIRELGPPYVVLENVAALLDRGMGDILGTLSDLGYDAEWRVLFASDAGAPQRRSRVFAIAYPRGVGGKGLFLQRVSARPTWHEGVSRSSRADFMRKLADAPFERGESWPEPLIRSVDDGIRSGLAKRRLHAYGNAVVPAVAEIVGRVIVEMEAQRQLTTHTPHSNV